MVWRIALVGGDEFRPGCEEMDRAILDSTGLERPSLLVIPTAAAQEKPEKAASNGVSYFSALGADASPLMVLDAAHANDAALLSPVDGADVLYLTGGSPTHLLGTLKGSLLLQKIGEALDRGEVLAGSSAGAMVMGPWMRFRGWSEGLGIVPGVVVLPHHESSDPEAVARQTSASAPSGVTLVGIDGRTCCVRGDDGWKVLGVGGVTAYREGRWRRFASGKAMPADPDEWCA